MQSFIHGAYHRLEKLQQKVAEDVRCEMNYLQWDPVSAELQGQLYELNDWLARDHNLYNLNVILTTLSQSDKTDDDGKYNKWLSDGMERYRRQSDLNASQVSDLLTAANQFISMTGQADASAIGQSKHMSSLFRTLVVKY